MAIYQIKLTNYCNSACKWCNNKIMKRERGFMSQDIFQRTISLLEEEPPANGVIGLHHFGESLLHPDIEQYIGYIESKNIKWRLSTNGRLLNDEKIRTMLLSFQGLLVISMENGVRIEDVNKLIKEKDERNSKLQILLQTFGNADLTSIIPGNYEIFKVKMHSWAQNGKGDYRRCSFLADDWACVLWDGTIVSCCFDMEGECILGHVNNPRPYRIKNHPWRACKTCEVVLRSWRYYTPA